DVHSAAEAVYHGLWLNEDLTRVNRCWHSLGNFDPRINPQDFEQNSAARAFLSAKAGNDLTSFDLAMLPRDVRIEWLDAHVPDLLKARYLTSSIQTLRTAAGERYQDLSGSPETAAVAVRLLYRAGLWSDAVDLATRHFDTAMDLGDLSQADELDQTLRDQRP